MLALFFPLAGGVLWLASAERVLSTPLSWNTDAQAVCVQTEACDAIVVAVRAVEHEGGRGAQREVPVDADLLLSAGHFLPTHAQRDDYYARHRALDGLLQADTVQLVLAGGGTRDVAVSDRGFGGIGAMLWLHVLFAALAWTSGLTHAVMRPQTGSYFLALSCVGYAVGMVLGGLELVHGVAWPLGGAQWINGAARGAVQWVQRFWRPWCQRSLIAARALYQFISSEVMRDVLRYTSMTMEMHSTARPVWLSAVLEIDTTSG